VVLPLYHARTVDSISSLTVEKFPFWARLLPVIGIATVAAGMFAQVMLPEAQFAPVTR
jgi:hypothetical protein